MSTSIQTFTGKWVNPFDLQPEDIDIVDIAHALSCINRFTGHARFPYSVAEHSIRCAMMAPHGLKLEALMHDASEAYFNDMARPIKRAFQNYVDAERDAHAVIARRFGLPQRIRPEIKEIDERMMVTEARALGFTWWNQLGVEPYEGLVIRSYHWESTKAEFMNMFERLTCASSV